MEIVGTIFTIVVTISAIIVLVGILFFCLGTLVRRHRRKHKKFALKGGEFMYIVKDNTQETPYQISFVITDVEGSPVPQPDVDVKVASDNESAVKVIPIDLLTGTINFGSPNADGTPATANISVSVSLKDGTLIGSFGAQFTVTAGDPAAIAGGKIVFTGLTESV
jgi:hypothetical protein